MNFYYKPVVTTGQTLISPLPFQYNVGSNDLVVLLNGQQVVLGNEYTETSPTSITFTFPLEATDQVVVMKLVYVISDLADVSSGTTEDGYVLRYDSGSSQWAPARIPLMDNLILNDITNVNANPNNGDALTWNSSISQWVATSVSVGQISAAGIQGGKFSVSYVSKDKQAGITDLILEVRDPNNIQVIASVPLTGYHGTGAYYAQVDVGVSLPGAYLAKVTSALYPSNNAMKIFMVSAAGIQGGGQVVQEATRTYGETFTFRHVATSALSDVTITIFNSADTPIVSSQPMVELAGTGVYKYAFNPPSVGLYTGVMRSVAADTRAVTEVIFKTATPSGSQSTVIANRVGVGTRDEC
jgi:hypothetical protein